MAEQRTEEWHALRAGKVTASRLGDVIAKLKNGGSSERRKNYMVELIAERLSGQPLDRFQSAAMRWGADYEAEARRGYEFRTGAEVLEVGFIQHPTIENAGASPDGFVGEDGLVEFKCPTLVTHVETLLEREVPEEHLPQIMWQLAVTGRAWCDFVSYDPRLPEDVRFFVRRVHRDDACIAKLEEEVTAFLAELEQKLTQLKEAA